MALSVERKVAEAKSRLVHLCLLDLNLRLMENWRSSRITVKGRVLDYESLTILMAIIVIGTEKLLRSDLDPELQTLTKRLPPNRLSRVSFSSIAAATGINRETVRRKIKGLQEAGMVLRDEEGLRIGQGVLQFEALREIIDTQLDAITRTVNQLSKLGVLLPDE